MTTGSQLHSARWPRFNCVQMAVGCHCDIFAIRICMDMSAGPEKRTNQQWRCQDLLRGGAEMEIMSWGTHGGLQGWVQQLLDD